MKAVVVYESLFGNTAAVAEAIAVGLRGSYEVEVMRVQQASPEPLAAAEFLVVGAPTHGHGLPSPGSRKSAAQREQLPPDVVGSGDTTAGVRELLTWLSPSPGQVAAAFDTRLGWPRFLSGAASKGIARRLRSAGFTLAAPPQSFVVAGAEGPMRDGEIERASTWGRELARTAVQRVRRAAA